jgi:hypothetical protein
MILVLKALKKDPKRSIQKATTLYKILESLLCN